MPMNISSLCAVALVVASATAQSTTHPEYMDRAVIRSTGSSVTVTANAPLPLLQALSAVQLEYGWRVNWEQAPGYSRFDVVDDTAPSWRAAHPSEKGVTGPSGGAFISSLPLVKDPSNKDIQREVLAKLLEDYNATDNPGKYVLRTDPNGQFSVVGTTVRDDTGALQDIPPLLDTAVTVANESRTLHEAVVAIFEALRSETGKKVIMMSVPNNEFRSTRLKLGGKGASARHLLEEALASTHRPLQYDLRYDPDVPLYILNVSVARQVTEGGKMPVPIDRQQ